MQSHTVDLAHFGKKVLELLDGARKALSFYPAEHPIVVDGLRHLEFVLSDLFLGLDEVTLSLVGREFYLNDCALKRESAGFAKLAQHLEERQATSIRFLPDVSAEELHRFVCAMAAPAEGAKGETSALQRLALVNVQVGEAVAHATVRTESALPEDLRKKLEEARSGYDHALKSMKSVFDSVGSGDHIDYRTLKATTEALLDSVVTNRSVWTHLLNVKHTDEYSYNHSVNVATLALLLATRLGLRTEALSVLGEAALLHDLGKQKVPAEILSKPGALTDEEWIVMRSHPEKGAKILLGLQDVTEAALMVAYEHHIRYDLRGYPKPRGKRELHLFSHLVAVADIYDALTSDRGYRKALVPDMAMRIILSQSGSAFHPLVVKHFVNLVGVYPVGTFVLLKSGEVAMVQYNQNRDLLRPVVLVIYDSDGKAMVPETRDLAEEASGEPPIASCIDPLALGLQL